MHLHAEERYVRRCDARILSLSWMGRVPDPTHANHDSQGSWKLNPGAYYQEGWLATGNDKQIVGVTFTASHCKKHFDWPLRSNFNLRNHQHKVCLVRWNEPYQKLASCDVAGVINVWKRHDDRWMIELINDRKVEVSDFHWSHDGRRAVISYSDNFVLVGSVSGHRHWSTTVVERQYGVVTCAAWSRDDQEVMFGTSTGSVVVMTSSNGAIVSDWTSLDKRHHTVTSLMWNCERFRLVQDDDDDNYRGGGGRGRNDDAFSMASDDRSAAAEGTPHLQSVIAVSFASGDVVMMTSLDAIPSTIETNLNDVRLDWSRDGRFLAVGGHRFAQGSDHCPATTVINEVQLYSFQAQLLKRLVLNSAEVPVPTPSAPPASTPTAAADVQQVTAAAAAAAAERVVTSLVWAHDDRRLFVACGDLVHTVRVVKKVPSLQYICHGVIRRRLTSERQLKHLLLPPKIRASIATLFVPTIKGILPQPWRMGEFACAPPANHRRVFCTMVRCHSNNNTTNSSTSKSTSTSGEQYVLSLEYLGGLVPIMAGVRMSKLRPEFVVYELRASRRLSERRQQQNVATATASTSLSADEQQEHDVNKQRQEHDVNKQQQEHDVNKQQQEHDVNQRQEHDVNKQQTLLESSQSTAGVINAAFQPPSLTSSPSRTSPCANNVDHASSSSTSWSFAADDNGSSTSNSCGVVSATGGKGHSSACASSTRAAAVPAAADSRMTRLQYVHLSENQSPAATLFPSLDQPSRLLRGAVPLLEVTSNIWGTKFQLHGASPLLPPDVASVLYKTSILHLQPRKMTVAISDLSKSTKKARTAAAAQRSGASAVSSENRVKSRHQSPCKRRNCSKAECIDVFRSPDGVTVQEAKLCKKCVPKASRRNKSNQCRHSSAAKQDIESACCTPEKKQPATLVSADLSGNEINVLNCVTDTNSIKPRTCPNHLQQQQQENRESVWSVLPNYSDDESPVNHCGVTTVVDDVNSRSSSSSKATDLCGDYDVVECCVDCDDVNAVPVTAPSTGALEFRESYRNVWLAQHQHLSAEGQGQCNVKLASEQNGEINMVDSGRTGTSQSHDDAMTSQSHTQNSDVLKTPPLRVVLSRESSAKFDFDLPRDKDTPVHTYSAVRRKKRVDGSPGGCGSGAGACLEVVGVCRRDVTAAAASGMTSAATSHCSCTRKTTPDDISGIHTTAAVAATVASNKTGNDCKRSDDDDHDVIMTSSHESLASSSSSAEQQSTGCFPTPINSPKFSRRFPFIGRRSGSGSRERRAAAAERRQEQRSSSATRADSQRHHAAASAVTAAAAANGQGQSYSLPNSPKAHALRTAHASPDARCRRQHQTGTCHQVNGHEVDSDVIGCRRCPDHAHTVSSHHAAREVKDNVYQDLAAFQKARTLRKMYGARAPEVPTKKRDFREHAHVDQSADCGLPPQLVMSNKAPIWNDLSRVYQLDFGGRVTQESAKNFQIEHDGQQVMQFGRVSTDTYTLDFKYPFSAVQAFGVALANVTQRFK